MKTELALCVEGTSLATTLARIELRRSPCLPSPRFLEGAPAGLLWPSFRGTPLPSEVGRLFLRRPGCLDPLHPHLIWQATESDVEGGNAFGLVFHLGFLPRLDLTADYRRQHLDLLFFFPEIMALVVVVAAVVVAAVAA
jgi:hypothetical protein